MLQAGEGENEIGSCLHNEVQWDWKIEMRLMEDGTNEMNASGSKNENLYISNKEVVTNKYKVTNGPVVLKLWDPISKRLLR